MGNVDIDVLPGNYIVGAYPIALLEQRISLVESDVQNPTIFEFELVGSGSRGCGVPVEAHAVRSYIR